MLEAPAAGIAATRPIAVANSASEMPGATTASEVFFDWAMWPKLFMMPHTVPNRPTKVALAPPVARKPSRFSIASIPGGGVRPIPGYLVTLITGSMRWRRAARAVALVARPFETERRHSRMAAEKMLDIGSSGFGPTRAEEYS